MNVTDATWSCTLVIGFQHQFHCVCGCGGVVSLRHLALLNISWASCSSTQFDTVCLGIDWISQVESHQAAPASTQIPVTSPGCPLAVDQRFP